MLGTVVFRQEMTVVWSKVAYAAANENALEKEPAGLGERLDVWGVWKGKNKRLCLSKYMDLQYHSQFLFSLLESPLVRA